MKDLDSYNKTVRENLGRPFSLAGRRAYLNGFMNGAFPPMGHHLPGEMGGLWAPPVKLADGYWFGLSLAGKETNWQWLYGADCRSFTMRPGGASRDFVVKVGEAEISATEEIWLPDQEPALFTSVTLTNPGSTPLKLRLAWLVRFDIQGSWWSNWPDRQDEAIYRPKQGAILARDSKTKQWCAVMRGDRLAADWQIGPEVWGPEQTPSLNGPAAPANGILRNPTELQGQGITGRLVYEVEIAPQGSQTLHFAIGGGTEHLYEELAEWTGQLLQRRAALWTEKLKRQTALVVQTPRLVTPRSDLNRVFNGSALCLDLLTQEIPGIGEGIMAGQPGFAWFFGCDTYYTLSGLLVSGQTTTGLSTLRILAEYARKQRGRIPHEIVQSGEMFNPGNPVETGEFATSVERAYRWTGNRDFLAEVYPVCVEGIFGYLLEDCDPQHTLLPDGPGLLELSSAERGKKLDVACALYQGLQSLSYLAEVIDDTATAERSRQLLGELQKRIESHFWLPERGEYVWRIEDDLSVRPDEPAHSYTNLEMGVVQDAARAKSLFERVEGPEHTGPLGLIHPGTTDFVMPIQNCIMALAEFRYRRPDQGLRYLQFCADLYGHYTSWAIPEFVGEQACFLQAWSSAAYNWLMVQGFFGLQPDPARNVILVQPQLPTGWDRLEVQNLRLWGIAYNLRLERQPGGAVAFSYTSPDVPTNQPRFEVVAAPAIPTSFV